MVTQGKGSFEVVGPLAHPWRNWALVWLDAVGRPGADAATAAMVLCECDWNLDRPHGQALKVLKS